MASAHDAWQDGPSGDTGRSGSAERAHACSVTGSAHRFEDDGHGLDVCACGALDFDAQLLADLSPPTVRFPGERMEPRAKRRAAAQRIIDITVRQHGATELNADALLDAEDERWRQAGGDTDADGRPLTTDL